MKHHQLIIVASLLVVPTIIGCGGSSSRGSRAEEVVSILKTVVPEAEARREVEEFEASLAKKSPEYPREKAWDGYVHDARRRVAQFEEDKKKESERKTREAERWQGAEQRWAKWVASKKSSGHLLNHLLAMRNLGSTATERATGGKFVDVPGYGGRLTLQTDTGIRIDAVYYGPTKLRNPKTGKWDIPAKFTPLSGFEVSLASGRQVKRATVLEQLGLPAAEFRAVPVSWANYAFAWKKVAKPLSTSGIEDFSGTHDRVLVFWNGP